MLQLFLNDILVDLTDDNPIALTFQINNLAEVKNQQGNTSNQFKLPLTQRNRQILGFPDDVAFTTGAPYKQYAAKLVQDGIEVIPAGVAELNTVEQDTASITVLSGNVDFFDAIDGKIYDTGDSTSNFYNAAWRDYDHEWTLDNVVASQSHTEGWIWPLVDYGKLDKDPAKAIDIRYLRPGFFLKSAIELMVKKTGYIINKDSFLVNDPLYNKLIVQFANDAFEHGTNYQNADDPLSASVENTQIQFTGRQSGVVAFQRVNLGYGVFSQAGNYFTAKQNMRASITFTYSLWVRGTRENHGGGMQVQLQISSANGAWTNLAFADLGAYNKNGIYAPWLKQKITYDIDLTAGDKIRIAFMPINDIGSEAYFEPGATLVITNQRKEVRYTQTVQCERIFPDIGQKDLLKDTLQRFGIICQTDSSRRQITLASFRNIVNNIPRANNWTTRCLNHGKTITFQLGGYAQINYLKYKEDDNVLPKNLADGQINVADATLPATATLFESQFAPTINQSYTYKGSTIAFINKIDAENGDDDFSISTQPRLLIDYKLDLKQQSSVTFTDGNGATRTVNDVLSVPYFDKQDTEDSLMFEKLRLRYYPELEKILQHSKKVVRWFMLSPRDIQELDLLVPIYLQQDSAYYYINKIDSWRKGQPTKVEMVKLG